MSEALPQDLQALSESLSALEREARALITGLVEGRGELRPVPGSWSVAECLDHLAVANTVYLEAMRPAAVRAREQNRLRRGPASPGLFGSLFVRSLEPPVRSLFKIKAPLSIQPAPSCKAADALAKLVSTQEDVISFLRGYADIDLAGTRFQSPFIRSLHFSLATGLHVIIAHEKRHLWQGWRIRKSIL